MCLNGFSPVVSCAAYFGENLIYFENAHISMNHSDWSGFFYADYETFDDETGYYTFPSVSSDDVIRMSFGGVNLHNDVLYLPDVYDYYLIITVYSACQVEDFTFAPDEIIIHSTNCDGESFSYLENFNYYHHDGSYSSYTGFSVTAKIPYMDSTFPRYIHLTDSSIGTTPSSDLKARIMVVAVEKGSDLIFSSIAEELNEIIDNQTTSNQLQQENNELLQDTIDKIEDQYSVSEEENFGVEDIVDQVNQKAGVLSFGTDTLVNFLDLFDGANATNTKLTFPGFSMEIQGVDYQVWPDYHYDLSELENQFGALIEVVRWGCVMVVWLAVLNYLVKAYDTIFGR